MASLPRSSESTPAGTPTPSVTNELALQFSEPPRQFIILTNVGLTFLVKRRALDYLKAVIEEVQSEGNIQPIIDFRDRLAFLIDNRVAVIELIRLKLW
jgi:nuclear pore complex protein Nup155